MSIDFSIQVVGERSVSALGTQADSDQDMVNLVSRGPRSAMQIQGTLMSGHVPRTEAETGFWDNALFGHIKAQVGSFSALYLPAI